MIMEQDYAHKYFECYEKSNLYVIISHLSSAMNFEGLNVERWQVNHQNGSLINEKCAS